MLTVRNPFYVKTLLLSSGERLPVILQSGEPLFDPTVYSLTEIRGRNRAAKTIESALRSLSVFFLFLDLRKISLESRIRSGEILTLGEIEDLVRFCRLPVNRLDGTSDSKDSNHPPVKVKSPEKHRQRMRTADNPENIPATAATRIRQIRDYLIWSINRRLPQIHDPSQRSSLDSAKRIVIEAIESRIPSGDNRGCLNQREGLDPEAVADIFKAIDPHATENPWRDGHCRYRNFLAIQWLYHLGLRRGELLNVRISDIDFRKGTVIVARRADDPNDPRRHQPNVKTRAREIPLSTGLLDITTSYIMDHRSAIKGARKHDFLFVSSDGTPLSIPSLAKVFVVLRGKCPNLPQTLTAHVLRHTWNDKYSKKMDENRVPEDEEKKTRSYLMGWSETSGTAATYTRRHIREKAQKASLEIQNAVVRKGKADE